MTFISFLKINKTINEDGTVLFYETSNKDGIYFILYYKNK